MTPPLQRVPEGVGSPRRGPDGFMWSGRCRRRKPRRDRRLVESHMVTRIYPR